MFNSIDPAAGVADKLQKFGFSSPENLEVRRNVKVISGYPKPIKSFRLDFEAESHAVEQIYYWIVGHARDDFGLAFMQKITDSHATSVASSMFGDMQGRISAQQSGVSNYMGMMGKLLKDLFALVRELRQIEERLGYYTQSYDKTQDFKARRGAETTLKDVWITLIEGGTQNPSSVYGMSQKVNFTILPDLFFAAPPMDSENEVSAYVEKLDFNKSVKNAVERKLFQYLVWKKKTFEELKNKKSFQIRYLRQHYETIRMYMQWIKPYLKNLRRLSQNQALMDDPMMVNSFQTSITEVEVLLTQPPIKNAQSSDPVVKEGYYPVVLLTFVFRTKPSLDFHQKDAYHQKGPIHVGRTEVSMRAYAWTKEEIENYKKYRDEEDFDMLVNFDKSVSESMEYLGADLERFLREAEAKIPDGAFTKKVEKTEDKKEPPTDSLGSLIMAPIHGLGDLLSPLMPKKGKSDGSNFLVQFFLKGRAGPQYSDESARSALQKNAGRIASGVIWQCFKNYKKAHRIVSW
jgi:hypothetical protein